VAEEQDPNAGVLDELHEVWRIAAARFGARHSFRQSFGRDFSGHMESPNREENSPHRRYTRAFSEGRGIAIEYISKL
jgi:hypothetical protein